MHDDASGRALDAGGDLEQTKAQRPRPRTATPAAFRYALAVSRRTPVAASMRRSDHPSRPNPNTCCCLPGSKTFPMAMERGTTPCSPSTSRALQAQEMAGFEVSINGRFWVSTEAQEIGEALVRNELSRDPLVTHRTRVRRVRCTYYLCDTVASVPAPQYGASSASR